MSTPVGTLPPAIPTVVVTGTYRGPDGRGLSGTVTFSGPGLLTFHASDLFIAGPVVARLDENGYFSVRLPATDAPDMNPTGWAYTVKENLTGVTGSRTFPMMLPKGTGPIDLADIAPSDPTAPVYVVVPGPPGPKGSMVFTGATVPPSTLGNDGDMYAQFEVSTVLGVSSTTVTNWTRAAGTWTPIGGGVRGAAIYVNSATGTPLTGTRPGDLLIRSDSGDLFQRGASSWETKGNLRGPQGAKGDKGEPGSGDAVTLITDWVPLSTIGTFGTTASAGTPVPRMRKIRELGTEIWEFEGALALSSFSAGSTVFAFTLNTSSRPAVTRGGTLRSSGTWTIAAQLRSTGAIVLSAPTEAGTGITGVWLDGWRITNPAAT